MNRPYPPGSLVIGVGYRNTCTYRELADLVANRIADRGEGRTIATIASVVRPHAATLATDLARFYGVGLALFSAEALASMPVATPSVLVLTAIGTPSVAEAAALLAAGPGGTLIAAKACSAKATCALARVA